MTTLKPTNVILNPSDAEMHAKGYKHGVSNIPAQLSNEHYLAGYRVGIKEITIVLAPADSD